MKKFKAAGTKTKYPNTNPPKKRTKEPKTTGKIVFR